MNMEKLKKYPTKLPNEHKTIIMEKLMPVANKLFEKWTDGLDRDTQHATWNAVAAECQAEGISVGDGMSLKNCVRNWINRAEQKFENTSDACQSDKTLTDLQKLCVQLIRTAKGNGLNPSKSIGIDNSSKTCTNQIIISEPQFEEYGDNSRESMLRQYHLLLQIIEIERRLGLSEGDVLLLRQSISRSLCDLPNARSLAIESMETEYLIEDFDSSKD